MKSQAYLYNVDDTAFGPTENLSRQIAVQVLNLQSCFKEIRDMSYYSKYFFLQASAVSF